ncbi:MAG: hypothetical protein NC434_12220 [Ruminococcus sp.]|nr:hypothetical protein [Ruminococcus sp.]
MKKNMKFIGKVICFLLLFTIIFSVYTRWITPKFFTDISWPTTTTYAGFYDMEKDSVDVLFLGSSHAITSFLPQELYDRYGITSYNIGCEQQGVVTSYYWLREALRYQSPKVVVLECYLCFPYIVDEPLNTEESYTRKAFDFMRWSPVKAEAVKTICSLDPKQDIWSYYFPNIRYHTRWAELDRNDFSYEDMAGQSGLKGFAPLFFRLGEKGENFVPHEIGASKEQSGMAPVMQEYLDKIVDLCKENDIALILTITPAVSADHTKCNTLQAYADERGLEFISFNEQTVYQQMDYQITEDNCDDGHPNIWGAVKVTDYIGAFLAEQFDLAGETDRQWEQTKEDYTFLMDQHELIYLGDIDEYLSALDYDEYTVVLASKDEFTYSLKESTIEIMRRLGLSADLAGQEGCNYLAVISEGKVLFEELSFEQIEYKGAILNGYMPLYALSTKDENGDGLASIQIGGEEYSKNGGGLNIVVYNDRVQKIVDSVWFNTYEPENAAGR